MIRVRERSRREKGGKLLLPTGGVQITHENEPYGGGGRVRTFREGASWGRYAPRKKRREFLVGKGIDVGG